MSSPSTDAGTSPSKTRSLALEATQLIVAVFVPLYGGLALGYPDAAFVAVVASLILYMVDIGVGRRGSPTVALGAGAVLFASTLVANALSGLPLAISAYVLALVFLGGLGSLYGRFWTTVGVAVPVSLIMVAYAIGESATLQDVILGLALGTVWSLFVTVGFGFLRPRTGGAGRRTSTSDPLSSDAQRALIAFSTRRTAAVALAMLIGLVGPTEKPYWIMLTVLMVLQPSAEESMIRGLQYGLGTAVGVVGSTLVLWAFGISDVWTAIAVLLLVVGIVAASQVDYGLQTALTTALVLTIIAIVYPDQASLFGERLLDAMAGIGIAMVVEYTRLMPMVRGVAKERAGS